MIRVHQARFGYDAGHACLASSVELTGTELRWLEGLSDLSGYLDRGQTYVHYDMGYPCGRWYARSRTWPDVGNKRPGTVYTHVLLLEPQEAARLVDPTALDAALEFVPLEERRRPALALDVVQLSRSDPDLPEAERTRLISAWFAESVRPILLRDEPMLGVRWLWRRLPTWGRSAVSWCSYSLRPRSLDQRPIDLQGVAPGADAAFAHLPANGTRELGSLGQLLDAERAAIIWAQAEAHGFAETNPLLWTRLLEREARADESYADALGVMDLVSAVPLRPGPQEALRGRVVDRLLARAELCGSLRELADLLVRDVDRALPGSRARLEDLVVRMLSGLDADADPADVALLVRSAERGGYVAALDRGLVAAMARGFVGWEIAWEHRPDLAAAVWTANPDDELATRFRGLTGPARAAVLDRIPEDDTLWQAFAEDEEGVRRALARLDEIVGSGEDWPAHRPLRTPPLALAPAALAWDRVPPHLAAAVGDRLAEDADAVRALEGAMPLWLADAWLASDKDVLARLLRASPALRAVARDRLRPDRWRLLLDATPDSELLDLDPPPSVVPRWLDRASTQAASAVLEGRIDPSRLLELLNRAPGHDGAARALQRVAAAQPDRVVDLLLSPAGASLRRERDLLLACLASWSRGARRGPDRVVALLRKVRTESTDAWEAGCSAVLAGILERPETEHEGLAAETFPVLHARLCANRGEGWLVRALERFWGGYWDRAGKLRERYARAWFEAGWPTSNLIAAAAGDDELLEKLGREVRWLSGGRRALTDRGDRVEPRAMRHLL